MGHTIHQAQRKFLFEIEDILSDNIFVTIIKNKLKNRWHHIEMFTKENLKEYFNNHSIVISIFMLEELQEAMKCYSD